VDILFDKESWNRRAGQRHAGIERGNRRNRDFGYGHSPTNRIAIHVLPHSRLRVGLNRRRMRNRTLEGPCS